jgi:cellulose biosynthesis protein BcsQ
VVIQLALLSGKGGSGKTSIALSLAKMLSGCGINTILIDCDLHTNGATYFVEPLIEKNRNVLSTEDLFDLTRQGPSQTAMRLDHLFKMNTSFHFVPSKLLFPNKTQLVISEKEHASFRKHINAIEGYVDVVLFDCQAGYSSAVDAVLSVSDINVVVMEPDAISSSSVRVLFAQIAERIANTKTYQVFSKITEEEYKIYGEIPGGTLFDPLPPITFNWEVRKAFALAQIPDLYSVDSRFGSDLYKLAITVFPKYRDRLFEYKKKVAEKEIKELEFEIEQLELQNRKVKLIDKIRRAPRSSLLYGFMSGIIIVGVYGETSSIISKYSTTISSLANSIISSCITLGIAAIGWLLLSKIVLWESPLKYEILEGKRLLSHIREALQNEIEDNQHASHQQ